MTWKLDGTIIAQCAFGSCNSLGALPSGDVFTHNESAANFYLDIGITYSDNGTMYQCDDGSNQDQTTVNIKVPPHTSSVSVTDTTLSLTAGCFYPSTDGKMEGGTEVQIGDTVQLAPTTTGCTGDCAGSGIFTATGSHTIDISTGSSKYRVYVYLDGFRSYNISTETAAIYDCECTVTVTNESGHFLCGTRIILKCHISPYGDVMIWKLDDTIIAQCAFGSCNSYSALPTTDVFTYNEPTGNFYLDISITHANNGTMYQCDDGSNQEQITVNIKVPPHSSTVTVTDNTISLTTGCFYPSTDGRMEDGNEKRIGEPVSLTPTTTGCTGDCAGPNIFTATGSIYRNDAIDKSTRNSTYRFYVYLNGFRNHYIATDTGAKYNCDDISSNTTPIVLVSWWNTYISIVLCDIFRGLIL
ncbi:hypothetical protein ACF0H5_024127 [Mactra antiquata]